MEYRASGKFSARDVLLINLDRMNIFINQISKLNKLKKHAATAAVVGILLNLINQWNLIISFKIGEIEYYKIVLTFIVPFAVSIYSAAANSK